MPSFFLKDCFIYFHKKVFSSCPHDSLIQVIEDVKKNIDSHISEYINLLRPIKDEQRGMIFHPYVLFPTRLTLQFCKPASADNLYLRMYNCLQELTVLTADRKIDFLRHVESLPPNTFTACLCLKVMTHLKFDNKNAAVELLRKHQFHCAQYSVPFRNISEEESKEPAIFDKLKAEIESTDTAWCFAFTYDQIRPFNFEFLNEELYDNCITRSKTYPVDVVVDFNCLTRLFYFLLCEDQSVLEKWEKDLIVKKAPLSEVYLCHYLKTSHLPLSEELPEILRRLNESIKKNVYDRNFLTRLVERFDSERRKIFCEWLDANIESAEFVTLYCASIVSGKALLSKAVKRAFQISEKALHYQDFIMLLEMQQRLCKFDHDYLDTWWARLTGLEERNLLNVEEIISFLESANAEKSERHLNSALSLIQKFEKVLRFLKLKDFQVLMQARKRLAELDSGYLNTWLKDFNTRVNDPENSHRVPFFIVELISLSNCLKTSHNPSDIKLFTKLTEKILRLGGLSKSDAARVKRVKFTLSKLG
ncbi:hypothetical protein BOX15_Mlig015042g1 [Macrostomum lignano]|uniref:Uncharacterized protein n=1 Tax=Macrostomum lignano TaxID=282301 RepID=A0A267FF04_9PLAT|nr:hypothetical protein BOX15_Mlig015042g1 [Macrostomum lignano]